MLKPWRDQSGFSNNFAPAVEAEDEATFSIPKKAVSAWSLERIQTFSMQPQAEVLFSSAEGGFNLAHFAAKHNRVDIATWLCQILRHDLIKVKHFQKLPK